MNLTSLKTKISNSLSKDNGTVVLLVATVIVNAGNYLLNLLLCKYLGPVLFAEANIIATVVMIFSFIALGIQLTAAKFLASTTEEEQEGIYVFIKSKSLQGGLILAIVGLVCSAGLSSFLKFNSSIPLLFLFGSLPLYFLMSLQRGKMQGRLNFRALARTYVQELAVKLLVVAFGLFSLRWLTFIDATSVLSIAYAFSFLITWKMNIQSDGKSSFVSDQTKSQIRVFIGMTMLYELSQILINYSDVILVKHFFESEMAGQYAAIALIGKAIFFVTWSLTMVVFPKAAKEKNNKNSGKMINVPLMGIALLGIFMSISCYFFDQEIISILFGQSYLAYASLLWKYAALTSIYSCVSLISYYHLSQDKKFPIYHSLVMGIVQVGLISVFHNSLNDVVNMQILSMSILFVLISISHLRVTLKTSIAKPLAIVN